MELSKFIETTVLAIITGTYNAQRRLQGNSGVNPIGMHLGEDARLSGRMAGNRTPIQNVDFDIEIEITEGTKTDANIGVVASIIKLGASGETTKNNSRANRIKFSIPIALPAQEI